MIFDKQLLSTGKVVKNIRLLINDEQNPVTKLTFQCDIKADSDKNEAKIAPSLIDYGRINNPDVLQKPMIIKILSPVTQNLQSQELRIVTNSSDLHVEELTGQNSDANFATSKLHVRFFKIWRNHAPKTMQLDDYVRFIFDEKEPSNYLEVRLRAEIVSNN